MQKDDQVYIEHMLDAAREAVELAAERKRSGYDADRALRLGLTHLIQMIGEAARKVSDSCKDEYPAIPWPKVVGMRHRIVHDYMDVDEDIVWDTVTLNLPSLIAALEQVRPTE